MPKQILKLCEDGGVPCLRVEGGRVTEASKRAIIVVFPQLGGDVFFTSVEPQKACARAPRFGWGELVSEMVSFASRARKLADLWRGPGCVGKLAKEIRRISGFGGKGFRRLDMNVS